MNFSWTNHCRTSSLHEVHLRACACSGTDLKCTGNEEGLRSVFDILQVPVILCLWPASYSMTWGGCWLEPQEHERGEEGEEMAAVCVSEYNVFELEFHSQRPCPMTSHWYDEKGVFVCVLYTRGDIICFESLDPFVSVCVCVFVLLTTDCVIGVEMLDVIDSRNSILSPATTKSDSCHCLWRWWCGTHRLCRYIVGLLTFHSSSAPLGQLPF